MTEVIESTPDRKPWLRCDDEAKITVIDVQELVNNVALHQAIRKIAADYITLGRMTSVGSVFYALPNWVIADFNEMQNGLEDNYKEFVFSDDFNIKYRLNNINALALLLATIEGVPDVTPKVLMESLPNLCALIRLESKFRKGLATVDYKQYSLFDADKHTPGSLNKKPEND